jgi:hypothetical protein
MSLTPSERSLRARLAAHAMHARHDPRQTTAAATKAQLSRYERQAIEEAAARGEPPLRPEEITRRAGHLLRAHMSRLSLAASRARARKAGAPPEPVR